MEPSRHITLYLPTNYIRNVKKLGATSRTHVLFILLRIHVGMNLEGSANMILAALPRIPVRRYKSVCKFECTVAPLEAIISEKSFLDQNKNTTNVAN